MTLPLSIVKEEYAANDQDLISKLPTNLTHKILKNLPLLMAARTSVLSKTWNENWLSLMNYVFEASFWDEQNKKGNLDSEKYYSIVTNILLLHNGPVHKFHLYIPNQMSFKNGCLNLSYWLSFLSKNGIKKMVIDNWTAPMDVSLTSYVYHCTNLVKLTLDYVTLNHPPTNFEGFVNLRELQLRQVIFKFNSFQSLIAKCPRLEILYLYKCCDMNHIDIDLPSLRILHIDIQGACESLSFKNIHNISCFEFYLGEMEMDIINVEFVDTMVMLASSCKLQVLHLDGNFCKILAVADIIRSVPLAFNHLEKLKLAEVDMNDYDVFCCTCLLIASCPSIKHLVITLKSNENDVNHIYEYDYSNKKVNHLRTIELMGIRGTVAELKLIEHLLAISGVLENLFYKYDKVDVDSEVKMLRGLMKFPRASTKAQLVYLGA